MTDVERAIAVAALLVAFAVFVIVVIRHDRRKP